MTNNNIKKETFSKRLKELMKEQNDTVYSVAEIIDLSPGTISRYLNKKMTPKITTVKILAQHYDINPTWLMGYSVEKNLKNNKISLSLKESELIKNYRKLNEESRIKIQGMIEMLIVSNKQENKTDKKGAWSEKKRVLRQLPMNEVFLCRIFL